VITKRGKPVAKLVPVKKERPGSFIGSMQGTMEIVGDIISPIGEKWDANGRSSYQARHFLNAADA
jgi:antitoxin (DNA-binding transcriptional repressor) of toxin-antitoxin stability system